MPALVIVVGLVGLVALAISGKMGQSVQDSINSAADAVTAEVTAAPDASVTGDPVSIALPLIQQFESCSLAAYADPPGQSTTFSIGWGHQIKPGESYDQTSIIGQDEADSLLRVDVGVAWTCVYQKVKTSLSPSQYAALISFCYNVGCGNFSSSTLLKDINAGDTASAASEFAKWNHAGGQVLASLTDRRSQEASLFANG